MKKRLGWAVAAVLVIAALAGICARVANDQKAVLEAARTLNYTVTERKVRKVSDAEVRIAIDYLRATGPKADRMLIRTLQTRDNALRRGYSWLWSRAPASLKPRLPRPVLALAYRQIALSGIGNLAGLSAPVERAVIRACDDPEQTIRERATLILGYRGSRSPETLRAFARAMSDAKIAGRVVYGPRELGFEFKPASVAEMIEDLERPYHEPRYVAARLLAERGAEAQAAVPALMNALADENEMVRIAAARALGAIGPLASNAVPALRRIAETEKPLLRSVAEAAMRQIESPPSQIRPEATRSRPASFDRAGE